MPESSIPESSEKTDDAGREAALMARYGITRMSVDRFHYREFRYTSLADAVAQSKRDATSS